MERNDIGRAPLHQELFRPSQPHPTPFSACIAKYLIVLLSKKIDQQRISFNEFFVFRSVVNSFILCAIQIFAGSRLANAEPVALTFFILSSVLEIIFAVILHRQPTNRKSLYFEVKRFSFSDVFLCKSNFSAPDAARSLHADSQYSGEYLSDPEIITGDVDSIRRLDVPRSVKSNVVRPFLISILFRFRHLRWLRFAQ